MDKIIIFILGLTIAACSVNAQGGIRYGLMDLQVSNLSNEIQTLFALVPINDEISKLKSGEIITDQFLGWTNQAKSQQVRFNKTYSNVLYPSCGEHQKIIALRTVKLMNQSDIKRIRFINLIEIKDCRLLTLLPIAEIAKLNTEPLFELSAEQRLRDDQQLFAVNYNEDISQTKIQKILNQAAADVNSATINCTSVEAEEIYSYMVDHLRATWSPQGLIILVMELY